MTEKRIIIEIRGVKKCIKEVEKIKLSFLINICIDKVLLNKSGFFKNKLLVNEVCHRFVRGYDIGRFEIIKKIVRAICIKILMILSSFGYIFKYGKFLWKKTSEYPEDKVRVKEALLYRFKDYAKGSKLIIDNDFVLFE